MSREWMSLLDYTLWVEVSLILSFTFVLAFCARRGLNYLRRSESHHEWLKIFAKVFYTPSLWLIIGYGVLVALQSLASYTETLLDSELIRQVRRLFLILASGWLFYRWKEEILRVIERRTERQEDRALIAMLDKAISIAVIVVAGLGVLDVFSVPLQALLAFGGLGGLAISWAAKDVIANFFGGMMIFINRPFTVDDWIQSTNKGFEGVVEDIGWYMTRIRTFERIPLFVPNALITDAIVANPGRMYNRRIKADIGVRYQDIEQVPKIVEGIKHMLQEHEEIAKDQTLMVHFTQFGASSLDINVYCFTKTTDWAKWRAIKQDVFLKIGEVIATHGAEIAFPTQTIHLEKEGATI